MDSGPLFYRSPSLSLALFQRSASSVSFFLWAYKSTYLPTYEDRYGAPGSTVHVVPIGVSTPPCYFLKGKLSLPEPRRRRRWRQRRRCALDAHSPCAVAEHYLSARPDTYTEEVASSRTYLEPPRRIKARPTGLRLQRSLLLLLPALRGRRSALRSPPSRGPGAIAPSLFSAIDAPGIRISFSLSGSWYVGK